MHDNECCREILDMALNRKSKIVSIINNELNQRINEAETHINDVNSYIKEMKDTIYPSEYYAPTKEHIETVYSEIISSYETIISSHLKKGEYKEAHLKLLEMEKYYSETPTKFKVKYWEEVFNPATQKYEKVEQSKTYDIKKLTRHYFAAIRSYVSNGGDYSEIDHESSETVLKNINSYIDKVKAYVPSADEECSPEILKHYQEQIDNKFLSSETSDHYYSQNRNITKMYFTKKENKELDSQDISDPRDNLMLRCVTDSKGPLYTFNQDIISMTSNRTKSLKLKKDWFYAGNYYAVFRPNEDASSNDKTKNLIKRHDKDDDELKHSICIADGLLKYLQDNWDGGDDSIKPNPFKKIKESKMFKNYLGEGVAIVKDNDPINRLKINENFLNTMGFEVLSVKSNYSDANNIEKSIYVENHVDWFIMQSHGHTDHAALVIDDDNDPQFKINTWTPEQLKIDNTNLSFFILSACSILSVEDYWLSPNTNVVDFAKSNSTDGVNDGIRWRKKMGKKVVLLGYSSEVTYYIMSNSIFKLITQLESYPALEYPYEDELKKFIINCWLEIHKQYSENACKNLMPYMAQDGLHYTIVYDIETIKGTEAACAIYKNIYYWLETKQNILDETNETSPNAYFTKISELDITNGL